MTGLYSISPIPARAMGVRNADGSVTVEVLSPTGRLRPVRLHSDLVTEARTLPILDGVPADE